MSRLFILDPLSSVYYFDNQNNYLKGGACLAFNEVTDLI